MKCPDDVIRLGKLADATEFNGYFLCGLLRNDLSCNNVLDERARKQCLIKTLEQIKASAELVKKAFFD